MTDLNILDPKPEPLPALLNPADSARIGYAIELLFFAYRDFTSDPDVILARSGYGRAHHRVIHFVGAYPGITVAQLLAILRITKQSLGRVLKQLIREGFIAQRPGKSDRRQRLLHLSPKGLEMQRSLSAPQQLRVRNAFAAAGAEAVAGYLTVLENLLNESGRKVILEHIRRG